MTPPPTTSTSRTVYTENAYGGHDRIADNNLLTLGVTTRLLDPDTGAENVALWRGPAPAFVPTRT